MIWNGLTLPDSPYYQDDAVLIYHADCRDILPLIPDKSIDLVLTDPPYPDQHPEYGDCDLTIFNQLTCKQLIFWSARAIFPLDYTARHIWDKIWFTCPYELIYERNGDGGRFNIYRYKKINNIIDAQINYDIVTEHPSQKPQRLVAKLITENVIFNGLLLDPFLGSGTTAYCAKKLGRKCIGIEIEEKYCAIAAKRCSQMVLPLETPQPKEAVTTMSFFGAQPQPVEENKE